MLVAEMRAPAVGSTERVTGRHIMVAPTVGMMGGCKPGTERVSSAPLTLMYLHRFCNGGLMLMLATLRNVAMISDPPIKS